jgi:hypothetical protein
MNKNQSRLILSKMLRTKVKDPPQIRELGNIDKNQMIFWFYNEMQT